MFEIIMGIDDFLIQLVKYCIDTIQKHENNYLKMPTLARDDKGNYYLKDA